MTLSSNGLVVCRLDGQIVFASTYFCELVNIHYSKIAGMSYFDFVFPDDLSAAKQSFKINKAKADPFSFRLRRMDGTPVWVDIQFTAMKSSGGNVYALSAAITAMAQVD